MKPEIIFSVIFFIAGCSYAYLRFRLSKKTMIGNGRATITLPPLDKCKIGDTFTIINKSQSPIIVQRHEEYKVNLDMIIKSKEDCHSKLMAELTRKADRLIKRKRNRMKRNKP